MLDAYRRGEDLHTATARAVLGLTEVTKDHLHAFRAWLAGEAAPFSSTANPPDVASVISPAPMNPTRDSSLRGEALANVLG
jgi:hypothetical protein